MRYLESERLLLRPIEEEDIYQLLELRWDRDVMRYLVHEPISKKKQLEWYRSLTERDVALSICSKGNRSAKPELVGTVGLYDMRSRDQLATWRLRLSPSAQGKEIGYESSCMLFEYGFDVLNMRKIHSSSFAENAAIIRLSLKLGFKEEGRWRQHYYCNGRFQDVIVFGLLREEFAR